MSTWRYTHVTDNNLLKIFCYFSKYMFFVFLYVRSKVLQRNLAVGLFSYLRDLLRFGLVAAVCLIRPDRDTSPRIQI